MQGIEGGGDQKATARQLVQADLFEREKRSQVLVVFAMCVAIDNNRGVGVLILAGAIVRAICPRCISGRQATTFSPA